VFSCPGRKDPTARARVEPLSRVHKGRAQVDVTVSHQELARLPLTPLNPSLAGLDRPPAAGAASVAEENVSSELNVQRCLPLSQTSP